MRISTQQLYKAAATNMTENQQKLAKVQEQITSGKNFSTLADDPIAANRMIQLKKEVNLYDMYNVNVEESRRRMEVQEEALSDIGNIMFRAREIAVNMGSVAVSDIDREAFASEMEEMVRHAASLMNTRDAKGEYLFAGTKNGTEPFVLDGTRYVYEGNKMSRSMQISSSQQMEQMDNGFEIFYTGQAADYTASGKAADGVKGITVTNEADFNNFIAAHGTLNVSYGPGQTITLFDENGSVLTDDTGLMVIGRPIDPVNGLTLSFTGVDLHFQDTTAPMLANATMTPSMGRTNILNEMLNAIDAIRTFSVNNPADQPSIKAAQERFLNQIDEHENNFTRVMAQFGGKQNALNEVEQNNFDYSLIAQKTLSKIEDLDYAKASTQLSANQMALEASYQSFSKIQGLTLFDYIR